jgi:hypothetical protein
MGQASVRDILNTKLIYLTLLDTKRCSIYNLSRKSIAPLDQSGDVDLIIPYQRVALKSK